MTHQDLFNAGFIKAALAQGMHPLKAVQLLKTAWDALDSADVAAPFVGAGLGGAAGAAITGLHHVFSKKEHTDEEKKHDYRTGMGLGALVGGISHAGRGVADYASRHHHAS